MFGDGEEELADEQDVELPAAQQQDNTQEQAAGAAGFAALRQKQKQQEQAAEAAQAAAEQRGQLQRLLEDYYKLDYEDMIGDVPCRFRYKQVKGEEVTAAAPDSCDTFMMRWCRKCYVCFLVCCNELYADFMCIERNIDLLLNIWHRVRTLPVGISCYSTSRCSLLSVIW